MTRYWVGWISGNYADEGCTAPPFKFWQTGVTDHPTDPERDHLTLCAVIDAESEAEAWALVGQHFPDYQQRFISVRASDYRPSPDRFP